MTNTEKLFQMTPKLDAIEFTGLARLLKVKLVTENPEDGGRPIHRDFIDVLNDMMENFDKLERTRKREILKLVKKATHGRTEMNKHASDSEDT